MSRKLVNTKGMPVDEWRQIRKRSIGGSDAGAIMGMNQWAGPVSVYADKMGLKEDKKTTEAMRLGTDLESYVASRFEEETGKKVRNDNFMYMHDEYDFITANIDRSVVGENAGLECKTMSSFANYDFDSGDVPANYYCQCQHYCAVMGYDRMYLAILVFQKGIFIVPIERNDKFINELIDKEVSFWQNHIEKKVMPAPSTEEDRDTISELYPEEKFLEEEIYIENLDYLASEIDKHDEAIKMHKSKVEELKARIQAQLKDYGRGYSDRYRVSWLSQSRTTVDSKALKEHFPNIYSKYAKTTKSRPLRIRKIVNKKEVK